MEGYTTHIKPKTGWFDIDLKELFHYRDLVALFVKRNYTTTYKQTILGPLWLILNPLLTVCMYAFVFGNIAGLSTNGAPQFAFYLASNAIWSYFSLCITDTSNTFITNAGMFGKVYFPRLVMPIASVLTGILNLVIQLVILAIAIIVYIATGTSIELGADLLLVPVFILQTAMLGLGCGIIVAACTTKYRDLNIVVKFGVQLWMYASPVVYSADMLADSPLYTIYMLNPMAPIITGWRSVLLGVGEIPYMEWGISWIITVVLLVLGVVLFSRVEKTFMDTV